jgi:hypothetical protein
MLGRSRNSLNASDHKAFDSAAYDPNSEARCGACQNCLDLARVRSRVLACCNPPFSHADDGVVSLWNTELARLSCTEQPEKP